MAPKGTAEIYVDKPPSTVLDYFEDTWFPNRPVFQNVSVDRSGQLARGRIAAQGSPTQMTVRVTGTGQGSTLVVELVLETDNAVGLLLGKKMKRAASDYANIMKSELGNR